MKPTISPTCGLCDRETNYCDALQALCWFHASERRREAAARLQDVLVVDGVAHVDRARAGGGCLCDQCGREYRRHPRLPGATFLNELCDGSLVKL